MTLTSSMFARLQEMQAAAQHLDEMLLRYFDAGMFDQAIENGCCGFDPWGCLSDFRETFKLPPTMSAEEWASCEGNVYPREVTP